MVVRHHAGAGNWIQVLDKSTSALNCWASPRFDVTLATVLPLLNYLWVVLLFKRSSDVSWGQLVFTALCGCVKEAALSLHPLWTYVISLDMPEQISRHLVTWHMWYSHKFFLNQLPLAGILNNFWGNCEFSLVLVHHCGLQNMQSEMENHKQWNNIEIYTFTRAKVDRKMDTE